MRFCRGVIIKRGVHRFNGLKPGANLGRGRWKIATSKKAHRHELSVQMRHGFSSVRLRKMTPGRNKAGSADYVGGSKIGDPSLGASAIRIQIIEV